MWISSDSNNRTILLGLKFSISGCFWVGKFGGLGEDKTWTRGPCTPCHGPGPWPVFFFFYKKVLH